MSDKRSPVNLAAPTPGPWAFEVPPADAHTDPDIDLDEDVKFWIVDQRVAGEVLALVHLTARGEQEANARLIATAPELLAALKVARETIRTWHGMNEPDDVADATWQLYQLSPEMKTINAAIAKAEGRR